MRTKVRTSTINAKPLKTDLVVGELAYSFESDVMFIKYPDGRIVPIAGAKVAMAPEVAPDSHSTPDTAEYIDGDISVNDIDFQGGALTLTRITYNGNSYVPGDFITTTLGQITFNAQGGFRFYIGVGGRALKPGQSASNTLGYTVTTAAGALASSTLLVTVVGTDQGPSAVADDKFISPNKTATGNVLSNDSDVEGETMTVTQFSVAGFAGVFAAGETADLEAIGTLQINANGAYTFVPVLDFSGLVPSISYTVTVSGATAQGVLTIVVQPKPSAMLSNPVQLALTGTHATYNVGPGQTHTTPDTVPWGDLVPGDVVNIYYRPTPYVTKIALATSGSFAYPIIINGVTDVNGNRPVIDCKNHTTPITQAQGAKKVFSTAFSTGTEGLGGSVIIKRAYNESDPNYKPSHIIFRGLGLTGAGTGNSFTTLGGVTQFYSFTGGVYLRTCNYITFENCLVYENIQGVFSHLNGPGPMSRCERITFRSCRFFNNGAVGSNTEHGLYIQGAYFTLEFCFLGQLRSGAGGSCTKMRTCGDVVRYCWIEANARALDMVEPEDQDGYDPSDPTHLANLPGFGIDHVYGNVIINDSSLPNGASYRPVHYGADNAGQQEGPGAPFIPGPFHRKKLFFRNNTFLSNVNGNAARNFIFQISAPSIVIEAWNNIFCLLGNVELAWTQHAGTINFHGTNLIYRSGGALVNGQYDASPANIIISYLGTVIAANPQFLSIATGAYDLTLSESSPALNMGTGTPAGINEDDVIEHPVELQPRGRSNGSASRPTVSGVVDLGAFEYDPAAPPPFAPVNTAVPTLTPGSVGLGETLTVSTGTWLHNAAGSYAYQIQRNISGTWTDISDATANTYQPTDPGDHRARVTATNAIGSTEVYTDLAVVSAVAINAPTLGVVMSAVAPYRNLSSVGGAGYDTQTVTNIFMFVVDSDATVPMTKAMIFDNASNPGANWVQGASVEIPGGTHARRVTLFYCLNANGKAGYMVNMYAGEFGYITPFVVEVPGNITVGTIVTNADTTSAYDSATANITGDHRLIAFSGAQFGFSSEWEWGNGFASAGIDLGGYSDPERAHGSVASRIATTGGFNSTVTIGGAVPNGGVVTILVPVRFT
jgi:hypothetical protein